MRREILDNMVDEELLVQQATRDTSVRLTEQEIQDQVEKTVQNVRKQFTNQTRFREQLRAAGFASEEEWRRWLADTQRRTIQQQRLIESLRGKGKLRPIPPTDDQMRAYWQESAAQRPKHPPLISFRQIVIPVQPDPAAVVRARALAESLKVALRGGAGFAEVAKGFSADSASRSQGGELGWFRRGVMVEVFRGSRVPSQARADLRGGADPVWLPHHPGGADRAGRDPGASRPHPAAHLARPGGAGAPDGRHRGEAACRRGAVRRVLRRFPVPEEPTSREGVPMADLPPDYVKGIGQDTVPGIVPPFEVDATSGRPKFAVVEITKWEPAGDLKFEDVKDRLRTQVGQQLAIKAYLAVLRRTTYVAYYP